MIIDNLIRSAASKVVLLYFDKTQYVNVNANFLISVSRLLTPAAQNDLVQDLHYILRFIKVKQQNQN